VQVGRIYNVDDAGLRLVLLSLLFVTQVREAMFFDRGAQVLAGGATTKSRRDLVITSLGMG
jgi:hypothetical protein